MEIERLDQEVGRVVTNSAWDENASYQRGSPRLHTPATGSFLTTPFSVSVLSSTNSSSSRSSTPLINAAQNAVKFYRGLKRKEVPVDERCVAMLADGDSQCSCKGIHDHPEHPEAKVCTLHLRIIRYSPERRRRKEANVVIAFLEGDNKAAAREVAAQDKTTERGTHAISMKREMGGEIHRAQTAFEAMIGALNDLY